MWCSWRSSLHVCAGRGVPEQCPGLTLLSNSKHMECKAEVFLLWKSFDSWMKWNFSMNFKLCHIGKKMSCSQHVPVSGLVSGGGGTDAVQERYTAEKWTLWDPKQHNNSGQQLCTGQREVWHTLNNGPTSDPRDTPCFLRRKLCMFSQYVYCVCVCIGPWAARMAATQRSRIQRLRSKPMSTPPPPHQSSMMNLMMRRSCPLLAPAKPCTHLKVINYYHKFC